MQSAVKAETWIPNFASVSVSHVTLDKLHQGSGLILSFFLAVTEIGKA